MARTLPRTVPTAPRKLTSEFSLELALERAGLTQPDSPVPLVNHFQGPTQQGAVLKDCRGRPKNAYGVISGESAVILLEDGVLSMLGDFHRRELEHDLRSFLPYCERAGAFIPLPIKGEDISQVRIVSQDGLNVLVDLVKAQLDGSYYGNEGLLFSRLSAAGAELHPVFTTTLKTAAQGAFSASRLRLCRESREGRIEYDFGLLIEHEPGGAAKVYFDNRIGTDKYPSEQGKARADFLLNRLASTYPIVPGRLEELRQNRWEEFGVNILGRGQLEELLSFLDESLQVWESGSEVYQDLISKLHQVGIPEEALWENRDFWGFVTEVSANKTISRNYTFHVLDEQGNKWLLKANRTKEKAEKEAAYNYFLSKHFDFVPRGFSPQPIEFGNTIYLTLQQEVSPLYIVSESSLEHKLACLAQFHREAAEILQRKGVKLSEKWLYPPERMDEEYAFLRNGGGLKGETVLYSLPYDPVFLREALAYIEGTDYQVLVHGDVKRDNWVGRHLVDGEEYGFGHPALDLALLFMQESLPRRAWGDYLHRYLVLKNNGHEPDTAEEKKLQEGMPYALAYLAVKEILGSTLRECSRLGKYLLPGTRRDNAQLCRYTEEELRGIVGKR